MSKVYCLVFFDKSEHSDYSKFLGFFQSYDEALKKLISYLIHNKIICINDYIQMLYTEYEDKICDCNNEMFCEYKNCYFRNYENISNYYIHEFDKIIMEDFYKKYNNCLYKDKRLYKDITNIINNYIYLEYNCDIDSNKDDNDKFKKFLYKIYKNNYKNKEYKKINIEDFFGRNYKNLIQILSEDWIAEIHSN
jgi:hypothetical protein